MAETYRQAQDRLFQFLGREGWRLSAPGLKVRHATSPDGRFRFWFKSQSIYDSYGAHHDLGHARSTFLDPKHAAGEELLAYEARARRREGLDPRRATARKKRRAARDCGCLMVHTHSRDRGAVDRALYGTRRALFGKKFAEKQARRYEGDVSLASGGLSRGRAPSYHVRYGRGERYPERGGLSRAGAEALARELEAEGETNVFVVQGDPRARSPQQRVASRRARRWSHARRRDPAYQMRLEQRARRPKLQRHVRVIPNPVPSHLRKFSSNYEVVVDYVTYQGTDDLANARRVARELTRMMPGTFVEIFDNRAAERLDRAGRSRDPGRHYEVIAFGVPSEHEFMLSSHKKLSEAERVMKRVWRTWRLIHGGKLRIDEVIT